MIKMKSTYLRTERDGKRHYRLTLFYKKRRLTIPWHAGSLAGEPTVGDVIYALIQDYQITEFCETYGEYLWELGSEDTPAERKTYKAILRQAEKAKKFFGDDLVHFEDLVDNYEELLEAL